MKLNKDNLLQFIDKYIEIKSIEDDRKLIYGVLRKIDSIGKKNI